MFDIYKKHIEEKLSFVYGPRRLEKKKQQRRMILCAFPVVFSFVAVLMYQAGSSFAFCLGYYIFFNAFGWGLYDFQIMKKAKDRKVKMRLELAAILDRMAVLLDAGVTLWNSVVLVCEDSDSGGAFEEELKLTVGRFSGSSGYYFAPEAAFEEMAVRCADATVSTFVSLVVQNSRKGTEELAELLRIHAVNARNERRVLAKQLAEEASTLMLLPSVMVLAAIMVLAATPAVIQFI